MPTPTFTTLGKIGRSYGVKGWFHVICFTEDPATVFSYPTWQLKDGTQWQSFEVEAYRPHGGTGFIAKLKGYDTPEVARLLTNREIGVPSSELPELAEDEYYQSELMDLDVYTTENVYLGKITQVLETGANDVLRVKGERERLVPYIDSVIQQVDLKQKRMTVAWDPEF